MHLFILKINLMVANVFLFILNDLCAGTNDLGGTTVSPIGPNEVPPPFQQNSSGGGVPMVTCRVCAAMIDISSKKEQHVVKCHQCQEATVNQTLIILNKILYRCS